MFILEDPQIILERILTGIKHFDNLKLVTFDYLTTNFNDINKILIILYVINSFQLEIYALKYYVISENIKEAPCMSPQQYGKHRESRLSTKFSFVLIKNPTSYIYVFVNLLLPI